MGLKQGNGQELRRGHVVNIVENKFPGLPAEQVTFIMTRSVLP